MPVTFNRSDEYAEVIPWKPEWDPGGTCPQVISDSYKTYLLYYINESDTEWNDSAGLGISTGDKDVFPIALVEFLHPHSYRFGIVNDEAASGHPLYGKGLEVYAAHIVRNSSWIAELKKIHKVHPRYTEERWTDRVHYLLSFHDDIFEIIATGYKIEYYKSTMRELSLEVINRLMG